MCLALLALFGLYVGNMLLLLYGRLDSPYTPIFELNSPGRHIAAQQDLYIISFRKAPVQNFLEFTRGRGSNLLHLYI